MNVKQCDRCGNYYDKNNIEIPIGKDKFKFTQLRINFQSNYIMSKDLCDDCVDKLMKFLENGEQKNGT